MKTLFILWIVVSIIGGGAVTFMGAGMIPLLWLIYAVLAVRYLLGMTRLREQSAADMAKDGR